MHASNYAYFPNVKEPDKVAIESPRDKSKIENLEKRLIEMNTKIESLISFIAESKLKQVEAETKMKEAQFDYQQIFQEMDEMNQKYISLLNQNDILSKENENLTKKLSLKLDEDNLRIQEEKKALQTIPILSLPPPQINQQKPKAKTLKIEGTQKRWK